MFDVLPFSDFIRHLHVLAELIIDVGFVIEFEVVRISETTARHAPVFLSENLRRCSCRRSARDFSGRIALCISDKSTLPS